MADISGTQKSDTLIGTTSDDTINAKGGNDIVYGDEGEDLLIGRAGSDTLYGEEGDDTLLGGKGNDLLYGGSGNDLLNGQAGSDIAYGETGDDTYIYVARENKGSFDIADGGSGYDVFGLYLTSKEFAVPWVQTAIQGYIDFLNAQADPNSTTGSYFNFAAYAPSDNSLLNLQVANFEQFKVFVNGNLVIDFATSPPPPPPTNTPPTALDDGSLVFPLLGTEDSSATIAVLANDTDPDADVLTVTAVGSASHGSLVLNANNTITYTPTANYNGSDSFIYTVSDGKGGTDTATVYLSIQSVNDAPISSDGTADFTDNFAVGGSMTAVVPAGSDVDTGETSTLTYELVDGTGLNGHALTLNPDGSFVLTPNEFQHLSAAAVENLSFTYRAVDVHGAASNVSVMYISVTGANDAPVAVADTAASAENDIATLDVLANDTDPDDGSSLVLAPGSAFINSGAGSVTVDTINNKLVYDPGTAFDSLAVGETAEVSIVYSVQDQFGAQSASTLTLTLTGTNDAPVSSDGTTDFTDNYGSAGSMNGALPVAYDIDNGDATALTYELIEDAGLNGHAFTLNSDGSFALDPAEFQHLAAGAVENLSFTYRAVDAHGGVSAASTMTITVNGANDAPVAVADTAASAENDIATLDVLANDTDPDDGSSLVLVPGSAFINSGAGSVTVDTINNKLVYDPGTAFDSLAVGETAEVSIVYSVQDQFGAQSASTLTLTLTGANDAPVSSDGTADFIDNYGSAGSMNGVLPVASDIDNGDAAALTYELVNDSGLNGHSITINPDGSFALDPAEFQYLANGAVENISFTYRAVDVHGGASSPSLMTITVTGVNDAPVAVADNLSASENGLSILDVLANDTDPDDGSSLVLVPGSAFINSGAGSVTVDTINNKLVYDPGTAFDSLAVGETAAVSIVYSVQDQFGAQSTTNSVTLTITGANDAPISSDGSANFIDNYALGGTMVANFPTPTDIDNNDFITGFTYQVANNSGLNGHSVTINPDGSFALDPAEFQYLAAGAVENISFTYRAVDVHGGASAASLMTITVTGVNDAPVAVADNLSAAENEMISLNVLANDTDPDQGDAVGFSLHSAGLSIGLGGTVSVDNINNRIIYDPGSVFDFLKENESAEVTISYIMQDAQGAQSSSSVNLTINGVNDAPVAPSINFSLDEDGNYVLLNGLQNATDAEGDVLNISSILAPTHGTAVLNPDNSITYTPFENYAGSDIFYYFISDIHGASTQVEVTVNVNSINDAPIAVDDGSLENPIILLEDEGGQFIDLLANDYDIEQGTPGSNWTDSPGVGIIETSHITDIQFSIGADGRAIAYITPELHYSGPAYFTYQLIEQASGGNLLYSNIATVYIDIKHVNHAPTAQADAFTVLEDGSITLAYSYFTGNDSDIDSSDLLTISAIHYLPSYGTITLDNINQQLTYTPDLLTFGSDSFVYVLSDGQGGFSEATVNVTIQHVNHAPLAVDDGSLASPIIVPMTDFMSGYSHSINVLGNDSDPDEGDLIEIISVSGGEHSAMPITFSGGSITYTTTESYTGDDFITYTIQDLQGVQSTATLYIRIIDPNFSPTAPLASNDGPINTNQNTPVIIDVLANDSDPGMLALSISSVNQPNHGIAVINPDNTITYTPFDGYHGTDSFQYTLFNGSEYAYATVDLLIAHVNQAPDANDFGTEFQPGVMLFEDKSVNIQVLNKVSDPDLDVLTVTGTGAAAHGSLVINPDNTITYTPDANYFGLDSFTYTVSDGNGGTDTATVYLEVTSVNDKPIANNDSYSLVEDSNGMILNVLNNDQDIDSLVLSISNFTTASHGTVVVNPDGQSFTYTPAANFSGTDSFAYRITDGSSDSEMVTVTLTVSAVNDAPTLSALQPAAVYNNPLTTVPLNLQLAGFFSDIDNDDLSYELVGAAPAGTALNLNTDTGSLSFTPNQRGLFDLQFVARDRDLGSDPLYSPVITIHVNSGNVKPIVANADLLTTNDVVADTAQFLGNVLTNDTGESSGRSIADLGVSNLQVTLPSDLLGVLGNVVVQAVPKSANEAARYEISGLNTVAMTFNGVILPAILSILKNGEVYLTNHNAFDFISFAQQLTVQFNYQEIDTFGQSVQGSAQIVVSGTDSNDVTSSAETAAVSGGSGNDIMYGRMAPSGINQTFDGGLGINSISYEVLAGAYSAILVNLNTGLTEYIDLLGNFLPFTDSLINIQNIAAPQQADVISTLIGNAQDNIFIGGPITSINGMGGVNTVSYAHAINAVTVDLNIAGAQDTGYGIHTLVNIQNLIGSDYNDVLIGNAADNVLQGGLGNDSLAGGAGFDTASYINTHTAVTVNLAFIDGTAQDTVGAGIDTLSGIEKILGSHYNDTLTHNFIDFLSTSNISLDIIPLQPSGSDLAVTSTLTNMVLEGGLGNDSLQIIHDFSDLHTAGLLTGRSVDVIGDVQLLGGEGNDSILVNINPYGAFIGTTTLSSATVTNSTFEGGIGNDQIEFNVDVYGGSSRLIIDNNQFIGGEGNDVLKFGFNAHPADINPEAFFDPSFSSLMNNQFLGGAGDDNIVWSLTGDPDPFVTGFYNSTLQQNTFDGGSGIDTFTVASDTTSAFSVNMNLLQNFHDFEVIDFLTQAENTGEFMMIGASTIYNLNDSHSLYVKGNSLDSVYIGDGWTFVGFIGTPLTENEVFADYRFDLGANIEGSGYGAHILLQVDAFDFLNGVQIVNI